MGKTLSDQAIIDIKRMKADLRRLMVAAGLEDNTLQTGPPHYLVLTPTGGIDAVDGDGIPGEAECQISRRWGTDKDIQDSSLKVKVYNHADIAIAEGIHILVHRDAWGDYYAGTRSPRNALVRASSGGIPARAGIDAGTGTAWICTLNDDNEIVVTDEQIAVFNWLTVAVMSTGSRLGFVSQDENGYYWATGDDCADDLSDAFSDPA